MITVLTVLYPGCVVLAFKVIKIKVNPVSIAVAVLIGMLMLGGVVIERKQSAPMTQQMFLRRYILQFVPDMRGFVSKVHVK